MELPELSFDAKSLLATLTELPGVYRMLDAAGAVLYVGKAKNLKKRVASYFRDRHPSPRIALMVAQIAAVETTVTRSEAEALLLENNLIKSLAPRYNILFRDDKSYPYIVITRDELPAAGLLPRCDRQSGRLFRALSVIALRCAPASTLLQKMFRLRTCENPVFNNRSRPCLLYQIKRCSGPCVGLIAPERYAEDVEMASMFLQGRQQDVIGRLSRCRHGSGGRKTGFRAGGDLSRPDPRLRQVQDKQYVESGKGEDVDVVTVAVAEDGAFCASIWRWFAVAAISATSRSFPPMPEDSFATRSARAFLVSALRCASRPDAHATST
jgi:excinuclease ABC subunit C